MSEHDPLCDEYGGDDGWGQKLECLCNVIRAVEARAVQRVEAWADKSTYPREAWASLFVAIKGDSDD